MSPEAMETLLLLYGAEMDKAVTYTRRSQVVVEKIRSSVLGVSEAVLKSDNDAILSKASQSMEAVDEINETFILLISNLQNIIVISSDIFSMISKLLKEVNNETGGNPVPPNEQQ